MIASSRNLIVQTLLLAAGMLALASVSHADPGAVYTLSNTADANRVLVYSRDAHGGLEWSASYPTGGKGSGAGLGSQGALTLSDDGRWLLAVNAGTNSLSVFSVHKDALVLTDIAASGGLNPISVTVADNLVYVLNAGGAAGSSDNISGFYLSKQGQLIPLPGSTQALSGANVAPAQVSFGLRGDVLVVTEKGTSRVDSFAVDENGRAGSVVSTPSSGSTPFGIAISSKGYSFVSEAVSSALSSYRLQQDSGVALVTGSLINHQAAACWAVLSKNEKYAYTANAATNTISGYRVAANGALTLLNPTGLTAATDAHPIDMAVSNNGRFLYSLNSDSGTLVAFAVGEDGSLTRVGSVGDLPTSVAGLAAR
jgi:6-phosphogluconolactonase (cycloisomerase 2 family)